MKVKMRIWLCAVLTAFSVSSVGYEIDCYHTYAYSDDPKQFAKTWQDTLAHWEAVIPVLSNREKEWLNNELNSGNAERLTRAMASEEYLLDESLRVVRNMRYILKKRPQPQYSEAQKYLLLLDFVNDYQHLAGFYLHRLSKMKIVTYPTFPSDDRESFIHLAITPDPPSFHNLKHLKSHITRCLIPKVLSRQE